MPYQNGHIYWICPVNNTGVALSVRGSSQVSQNRDVFLYTRETIGDQLWRVEVGNGYARIKSLLNENYALNIYLSTGNCDIHTWADNLEDSKINFRTIDAGNSVYRIQNYRNNSDNNLYLTAGSTSSGGLVTWNILNSGSTRQQWKLIEYESGGGTGSGICLPCKYTHYGYRYGDIDSRGVAHNAVDLVNSAGTKVYAWCDGVIARRMDYPYHDLSAEGNDSLGNCLFLHSENPNKAVNGSTYVRAIYAHLQSFEPGISEKVHVRAGQLIGYMGQTGYAKGEHLHFAMQCSDKYVLDNDSAGNRYEHANWVNPASYLPQINQPNP